MIAMSKIDMVRNIRYDLGYQFSDQLYHAEGFNALNLNAVEPFVGPIRVVLGMQMDEEADSHV